MFKTNYVLLIIIVLGSIAKADEWQDLNAFEKIAYKQNEQVALELLEYDRYCWIASDSVMKLADTNAIINTFVCLIGAANAAVYFGDYDSSSYKINFLVDFNADIITAKHMNKEYKQADKVFNYAKIINKTKNEKRKVSGNDSVRYNSYVIKTDYNEYHVYLIPGNTDETIFQGGNFKAIFDTSFNLSRMIQFDNGYANYSVARIIANPYNRYARSSSRFDIINEADLMQHMLAKHLMPVQYVMTEKYWYKIFWDEKQQRIVPWVMPN